jgi:hypothetical protein
MSVGVIKITISLRSKDFCTPLKNISIMPPPGKPLAALATFEAITPTIVGG